MSYRASPLTERQFMSRSIDHSPYSRGNDYSSAYNGSRKRSPESSRLSHDRRPSPRKSLDYADEPNGAYADERSYSRRANDRDRYRSSPPPRNLALNRSPPDRRRDRPRDGSPPEPSKVLGVFGLSTRTEERDLYDIMKKYGNIEDIQVVYDNLSGRSRGFAFVYFETVEDARTARAACARGLELHGRIVRIDYSKTKKPHDPTPGVYMGKDKRRPSRFQFGGNRRYAPRPRSRSPVYANRRRRSRSSPASPPRGHRISPDPRAYPGARRSRQRIQSSSRSRSPPQIYSPKRSDRYPIVDDDSVGSGHFRGRSAKGMGSYPEYGQR